jgi:salicylate hydroxylase
LNIPHSNHVALAGGGIGGLACALALARKGFRSIVLEQASSFGEIGVGLQVAPNALAVLEALGVGEAKQNCLLIDGVEIIDAVSGEAFINIPFDSSFQKRFGNPYAVAHRADIHGALLRACQGHDLIELRTNSHVIGFEIRENGVAVEMASKEAISVPALIGADGIRSRIRSNIVGDGEPLSAGAVIYRALIPASDMPAREQKNYPTIWAGPGSHMIYYPIRDKSAFNLAVTVVDPEIEKKGEGKATREEALEAFKTPQEVPRHILSIPERFDRYVIRHRKPVANWTRGPVTLLGDAAHPMVQYIAQGAAMALEDAICLAEVTAKTYGDFSAAFQRYQQERIVRSARVQIASLMMDKILHANGIERLVRNSVFDGLTAEDYHERLSWLYGSPWYVR